MSEHSVLPRWGAWVDRHPTLVTDAAQISKTVVATVLAWWVAESVLGSAQPFLAPWTALMTVHATVRESALRAGETTLATLGGVVLAFALGVTLGVDVVSLGLAMAIGLVVARAKPLRREGVAVATTALFVLAGHDQYDTQLLVARVVDVVVGAGIGLAVNVLLLPPLRDRQAQHGVDQVRLALGHLLVGMAGELGGRWDTHRAQVWVRRTVEMDGLLDRARGQVRLAGDSASWNPRARRRAAGGAARHSLDRLREAVSHLRHLVRVLDDATYAESRWDEEFRRRWVALVDECGRRLLDPAGDHHGIPMSLDELAVSLSRSDLPTMHWPVYGSLITSLRQIAVVADDVAHDLAEREPPSGRDVIGR
ncbi:FUSC family protein [Agilicoccus flavus]|uniref:FUSC family protein n=1 Tax=Agilicoccus flavus TaxID=2775968 RepID=UPI001CF66743|nr:aromatic acid exporter family protein [Agilicoccus flavus]